MCGGSVRAWVCFVCILLWHSRVVADVVVIVPPHVASGVAPDAVERALDVLGRALRLDGFDPISSGQAAAAADDAQTRGKFPRRQDPLACITSDCALAYRALFDAIFAVQLALRQDGHALSVSVRITEQADAVFGGSQPVEGGDLAGAVRDAYRKARELQAEGAGPFLTVTGEPAGAWVYVDGAEFGRVPIRRRRIEHGEHKLELRADGYITATELLTVPERLDFEASRHVVLAPLSETERARHRHWLDWTLGSAAVAAGGLFTAAGVREVLRAGTCTEQRADGTCARRVETDAITGLNIGLGFVGIALGVATMAVGPFGYWLEAGPEHASLHLGARL